MTLFQAPLLTDGATHSAQQFRMMIRDLANGSEGITQGEDLKVVPQDTPNGTVLVGDGSGIVRSKINIFGGSYSVCNVGAATVAIAPTGATPRSDMVVLRVLDPEYEGNLDPATDPVMFFDVITNVLSTATEPLFGYTAIPLARIDLPASTTSITAAMIKDVRKIANPRRVRTLLTYAPTNPLVALGGTSGNTQFWSNVPGWNVPVPAWATTVKVVLTACQAKYDTGPVYGSFSAQLGSSLALQTVIVDDDLSSIRRGTVVSADTRTIPEAYRGTTQLLRPCAALANTNLGRIGMDSSVTLVADVEFEEAPR